MANHWFIEKAVNVVEDRLDDFLLVACEIIAGEIKAVTPVDKGRLRNGTDHRQVAKLHRQVFNDVEYAAAVEFGTGPHVILPKTKRALAFKMGGKQVVVKKVLHPGTPPQPFFRRGSAEGIQKVKALL